jgi:hypothetical protein
MPETLLVQAIPPQVEVQEPATLPAAAILPAILPAAVTQQEPATTPAAAIQPLIPAEMQEPAALQAVVMQEQATIQQVPAVMMLPAADARIQHQEIAPEILPEMQEQATPEIIISETWKILTITTKINKITIKNPFKNLLKGIFYAQIKMNLNMI